MTDQITRLLDQIQLLDEEATAGPWDHESLSSTDPNDRNGPYGVYSLEETASHQMQPVAGYDWIPGIRTSDAEFIAEARTALPATARALKAVLELHRPLTKWSYKPSPEWGFDSKEEVLEFFDLDMEPHDPDDVTEWQVCAICAEVEQGAAEDYGYLTAIFPCATYKAITAAIGDDQ